MEIKRNVEREKQVMGAMRVARRRDGMTRDQKLLLQQEPNESLRRLVIARGQLTQARLCYWGLPNQAVIWAYQAIDNAISAALLADDKSAPKNHRRKLELFFGSFPDAKTQIEEIEMSSARQLWNEVRYERTAISRETGQHLVELGSTVFQVCCGLIAPRVGISLARLHGEIEDMADRVRQPATVSSEAAMEAIEDYNEALEIEMQRMGLSSVTSQAGNQGRDIFLEMTAETASVRDLIEEDPRIADDIVSMYRSFHGIVSAVVTHRLRDMIQRDPSLADKLRDLVPAADFKLTCVMNYSGLATADLLRRLLVVGREAEG